MDFLMQLIHVVKATYSTIISPLENHHKSQSCFITVKDITCMHKAAAFLYHFVTVGNNGPGG